ncbi:MAG: hypothetical protein ACOC58_00320 [Chloroflexota bacterium]
MVTDIRTNRGGFLRPFGCGWFIREFLLGHRPEGAPAIDPDRGAPQTDIRYHYKAALYRAYARDGAEREISRLVLEGVEVTDAMAQRIYERYLRRIPYKLTKCRYHSFLVYFRMLKQLGWVEATGEVEPSSIQDNYPAAPPRIYYRLTETGKQAPDWQWSNPQFTLYPHLALPSSPPATK